MPTASSIMRSTNGWSVPENGGAAGPRRQGRRVRIGPRCGTWNRTGLPGCTNLGAAYDLRRSRLGFRLRDWWGGRGDLADFAALAGADEATAMSCDAEDSLHFETTTTRSAPASATQPDNDDDAWRMHRVKGARLDTEHDTLRFTRDVTAPVETVWAAYANIEDRRQWSVPATRVMRRWRNG